MAYSELSIRDFTERLASSAPVPGGGGAAGLAAAVGTALGSMAANLTVGKKAYADAEGEMNEALETLASLREDFFSLMDADAENFQALMASYALPKESDKEKAERKAAVQEGLKTALAAPAQMTELCLQGAGVLVVLLEKGNKQLLSDVACAAAILRAASSSAYLNVLVNLQLLDDEEYVRAQHAMLDPVAKETENICCRIEEEITAKLRGEETT